MMPPSRMSSQWEEGMGESTSPLIASSGHDEELRCQMYQRLVAAGHPGASKDPSSFREKLYTHFQRLPRRYLVDYMGQEAEPEDVLLHMEILDQCEDPENRPVFVARFIKYIPAKLADDETNTECDPCQRLLQDLTLERKKDAEGTGSVSASSRDSELTLIHEIIFSSLDRPKILSRLTALLSEVDLNIREAHVYNTTDGYCLDVFVVEGWKTERTDELITKIKEKLLQKNASPCNSTNSSSSEKILELRQQIRDCEINWSMLTKGEKIASGSSADLYRGTYNGLDVAIKELRIAHHNSLSEVEFLQEVLILRRIEDENILKFYGACTSHQNYCIVTEYMPEGNLYDFLHKQNDPLDLLTILRIAISISKGMKYLHLNNIIHRDLKTANVLLGSGQVVKIADFGVARLQEGQMTAETGTYRWMAPEIINHEPYNHKADVFSFAIVLWELITLKVPYDNMTPMQAALGVRQGNRLEIPQNAHPRLSKLIQQCWDQDPDVRPAFVEILKQLEDIRQQVQAPKGTRRRSRTEMQKKVPVRFREVSGVGEEDSEKGEHLKEGSSSIGLNGKTESAR